MDQHKHSHPHHHLHAATKRRIINIVGGVTLGLVLAGGVAAWQMNKDETRVLEIREKAQQPAPAATIGGAFTLTDLNGKVVTDQTYRGKYLLINFGYTFCPDMCPTGLQSIGHALKTLGDKQADRVQPLFISVDPGRDTTKKLRDYVNSFSPRIMALRGDAAQTAAVAKAYQVYYAKQESEDGPEQYEIDHTSIIYLMGSDGKYIASFPDEVDPATLVDALHKAWGDPVGNMATPKK